MATIPNPKPEDDRTVTPTVGEIARAEDAYSPLRLDSLKASNWVELLAPTDTVLQAKGGIANLQVYRELLRDDQVSSAWTQRRLALTACDTVVEPGADDALSKAAAAALEEDLAAIDWDDITDKALFAVFYGWGVAEVMWSPDVSKNRVVFDTIKVRDRARFRFDRDGGVHLWTSGSGFVQMPERKFWVMRAGADHHDEQYGLGLAHQLYWPVFFKRNDIKFWLIFLEKFGMPTAVAKLPQGTLQAAARNDADASKQVANAVAMLRRIATDAGVVVPENTPSGPVVELLEAARSGAADYKTMQDAMDAAIAKIIIGQTATTQGTPGRLGSDKTQEGVAQKIVEADADLLCGSFNAQAVKWWTEFNFPGATPPKVYRHTEPAEDMGARAERDSKIFALGYEPEESYILETYGPGWKKKQAPAMPAGGLIPGQQPGQQPAQFAEGESAALQALRAARRGDQQALLDAAVSFAEQYETIMGQRVAKILQFAEEAGDPEVFRQRLAELLEEDPAPEAVQAMQRGNFFARMMGALRMQRRA